MTKPFNPLKPAPCVYWKHGAYWLVKKGKWTRIGATLEEALAEYGRRVQAPKDGKLPALIEATLRRHIAVAKVAPATQRQYRIAADVLKRRLRAFDSPAQVKGRHVAQIKTDGAEHPNMTNRVLSVLRTLFGYWLEDQLCDSNPCAGVKRHREAKRKRLISEAEWWAIHDAAVPRLRATMKLQFLTGQRISDVLKLRRSQLKDDGIEFKQQKTGKLVLVEWTDDLRQAVADALALHAGVPSLYVLPSKRRGKAPDYRSVLLQWNTACEVAGVEDARPNDQRAQSLSAAKRQGKNATELAGHATEAMTQRYLREREATRAQGPTLRQPLDVGRKAG